MMKAWIASLTVMVSLLLVALLALFAYGWSERRELTTVNAQLLAELAGARAEVESTRLEARWHAEKLAGLEITTAQLQSHLETLQATARAGEETLPRAYRVRAYLGRDSLGDAWMVPQNITRDPDTGRYRFEPVLLLDESNRERFTVHHTNVFQTEVATTEYVPYYHRAPFYYVGGVPGRPGISNRPPDRPQPPREPAPVLPSPGYGDVSLRGQLFAPPFSTVNTRPQVLGRPATSPINAQLFAP